MKLHLKRIYTAFFFGLFFLIAPFLILFANGYRFDRFHKIFIHSGSLVIKSTPRKVDIYLDNRRVKNKKLNFINNYHVINGIKPGWHTIRCQKDGYTTWEKRVDIHSGISTEFWNVVLVPKPNKTLHSLTPRNVKHFFLSPRNDFELVLHQQTNQEEKLSLYNSKKEIITNLLTVSGATHITPETDENVEWSSNHQKLLIPLQRNGEKDYALIKINKKNTANTTSPIFLSNVLQKVNQKLLNDKTISSHQPVKNSTETKSTINLSASNTSQQTLTKQPMENKSDTVTTKKENPTRLKYARWVFGDDQKIAVLTQNNNLLLINIEKPEKSYLIDNQVLGFDFSGNHLYYLRTHDHFLLDVQIDHPEKKKIVSVLPVYFQQLRKMTAYDEYRLAFLDDNQQLFILNNDPEHQENFFGKIADRAKDFQFSDDGKKILFWNNNEIFVYFLREWKVQPKRSKGDKILVTRFSSSINNVQWMQNFENVIFTKSNLIKMAEIDNRDRINLVDIFQAEHSLPEKSCLYDKKTFILYFLDPRREQIQAINLHPEENILNKLLYYR